MGSMETHTHLLVVFTLGHIVCVIAMFPMPTNLYPDFEVELNDFLPREFVQSLKNFTAMDIVSAYCPFIRTCYQVENALPQSPFQNGCCLPCDCSEECFATGHCCHDKEKERPRNDDARKYASDGTTCISLNHGTDIEKDRKDSFFDNVMLQQKCPDLEAQSETNAQNVKRCHFPSEDNEDDVTPVTNKESLVNYRNKFCAACNNVTDNVLPWTIMAKCSSTKDLPDNIFKEDATRQEVYNALRSKGNCSLLWRNSDVSSSYCRSATKLVSVCPTGTSKYLEELCEGEDALYLPYVGFKAIYRNMFCLLCNAYAMDDDIDFPSLFDDCPAMNGFQEKVQLTLLLDFNRFTNEITSNTAKGLEDRCMPGHVYSEDLSSCIEVTCPLTEIMAGNRCIKIIDRVGGVSLQYRFDFTFNSKDLFLIPSYSNSLLDETEQFVNTNGGHICNSRILGTRNEGNNIVVEVIVSKYVSFVTSIREEYNVFKEKIVEISKQNRTGSVLYTISIGESSLQSAFQNETRFLRYEDTCIIPIAMTERQFCRLVVVRNYQEENGTISIEGIIFYGHEFFFYNNQDFGTSAFVCEDLYVERMTRKRNLFANSGPSSHKMAVILNVMYVGFISFISVAQFAIQ